MVAQVTLPEKQDVCVSQWLVASVSKHQDPVFHLVGLKIRIQLMGTVYWGETWGAKKNGGLYGESHLLGSQQHRK